MALSSKAKHLEIANVEQSPTHVLGFLAQAFWKRKIFPISCFAVCIFKRKKFEVKGEMCDCSVTRL